MNRTNDVLALCAIAGAVAGWYIGRWLLKPHAPIRRAARNRIPAPRIDVTNYNGPSYVNGEPAYVWLTYRGPSRVPFWYVTVMAAEDTYYDGPFLTRRAAHRAGERWMDARRTTPQPIEGE